MAVRIKDIFREIDIPIPEEIADRDIRDLQYDSRKVNRGDLFIAVKGFETDGHRFVKKAESAGAMAAIVEEEISGVGIPQIKVSNTRKIMADLAYVRYREDFEKADLIGVTGTNGKTTTTFLIRSILKAAGHLTGLIGTIAYYFKDQEVVAWNTTPEAIDIARMVHDMVQTGHDTCVLEVSSHALALNRVDSFPFKVGVFTNLSHDHLDFHKNVESYFQSKLKLFDLLTADGRAVVNLDDPYAERILERLRCPVFTFGFSEDTDVRALDWTMSAKGTRLNVRTSRGEMQIQSSLISLFNIQNILAAVATGIALGLENQAIVRGIADLKKVPGRLETYEIRPDTFAVIDYAHTPDALRKAAEAVRNITKNRLIIIFGCGGDRDQQKRPIMGRIAEQMGDHIVVTSDNPRNEEPEDIIREIVSGMSHSEKYKVITDRKEAIFYAVRMADAGDTILVAGKGHEPYQTIKGERLAFNEKELIQEAARHA